MTAAILTDLDRKLAKLPRPQAAYLKHAVAWTQKARLKQLPPAPEDQTRWFEQVNAQAVADWLEEELRTRKVPAGEDYEQWLAKLRIEAEEKALKAYSLTPDEPWTEYGAQAGRGWGKTFVGAEWLYRDAWEDPQALPRCVIAPTQSDVRFTCFEGETGLMSLIPPETIDNYNRSELMITLKNGATIRGFSAEKADRLRGPQHAAGWCLAVDTQITMGDGTLKAIQNVKRGDEVLTRKGPRRVLAARRSRNPNPWVDLRICSQIEKDIVNLRCTVDHPLWANGTWTEAVSVQRGAELLYQYAGGHGCDDVTEPLFEPAYVASSVITPRETMESLEAKRIQVPRKKRKHGAAAMRPANQRELRSLLRRDACYCLKVEGEPEYFANGVLVHNCDELAGWGADGNDALDMFLFGLRLGPNPRFVWTSTPKPIPLVRRLTAPKAGRIIVRGSTYENKANLPKTFFDNLAQYEGTRLGRQEIHGDLIDPEEAGIVKRSQFRLWPAAHPLPRFEWVILSLDTAFTEKTLDKKGDPDPTAASVWGVFTHERRTNLLLLDCWEDHLGLPDLVRRVRKEMSYSYGDDDDRAMIQPLIGSSKPRGSGRKPDVLLIEDKGSGISLRQTLAEMGIEAHPFNPGRADKLARLHIVSPIFAQKRIWVPESMDPELKGKPRRWAEPLIDQLCTFAGEGSLAHDDFVDSTTQAVRFAVDNRLLEYTSEPQHKRRDREEDEFFAKSAQQAAGVGNPYDM